MRMMIDGHTNATNTTDSTDQLTTTMPIILSIDGSDLKAPELFTERLHVCLATCLCFDLEREQLGRGTLLQKLFIDMHVILR